MTEDSIFITTNNEITSTERWFNRLTAGDIEARFTKREIILLGIEFGADVKSSYSKRKNALIAKAHTNKVCGNTYHKDINSKNNGLKESR